MSTNPGPVVVGYDGSPDADLALRWAIRTVGLSGEPLRVVIAAHAPEHLPPAALDLERRIARDAASWARDRARAAGIEAVVLVEHGAAIPVLLRESTDAALLVVGSHGHGALEGHLLGSVSQSVAGHADCPVAVIRPARVPDARQVVVGVDGSEAARRALIFAVEHAGLTDSSVLAVHAYQVPMFSGSSARSGLGALPMDIDTDTVDGAERLAAELVAGVRAEQPDVPLRSTAVMGSPAEALVRLANSSALLVVGSRGRMPLSELVLGSVSQETLRHAHCPVVVVP